MITRLTLTENISEYAAQVRDRILVGIRLGMRDAMQDLATYAGEVAPKQSGRLAENITDSVKVYETPDQILGTVGPTGFGRRLLNWIQAGTNQPAVNVGAAQAKYARIQARIASGSRVSHAAQIYKNRKVMISDPGNTGSPQAFFMSRKAFSVAGRPVMQQALEQRQSEIFGTIQSRINEARTA